jgi:hypothetical protein
VDNPSKGSVNYKEVIDSIKLDVNASGNTFLQYTVFATLFIASGGKNGLTALENNYSNITIDQNWNEPIVRKWFSEKLYFCGTLSQDKSERPYVRFSSFAECISMLCEWWSGKIGAIVKNIETPDDIAKFWILYNNSSNQREENVYTSYNSTELEILKTKINESFQKFNSTTGNVTNTQPAVNVPPPPPYLKIVNLGTFDSIQGNDYSYRNIQQLNGKFIVLKIEDPNFSFDKLGITTFLDGNNQSIGYGCSGGSGALTCTVNGKAPGVYTMVQEYYPYKPQNWDKFEIRSAPFNQ